jgi:hypothetical protein
MRRVHLSQISASTVVIAKETFEAGIALRGNITCVRTNACSAAERAVSLRNGTAGSSASSSASTCRSG